MDGINGALRVSHTDTHIHSNIQMTKWVELGHQWLFESLKLFPSSTFLQASSGLANPLPFRSRSIVIYFNDTGYFKSIVSLSFYFFYFVNYYLLCKYLLNISLLSLSLLLVLLFIIVFFIIINSNKT